MRSWYHSLNVLGDGRLVGFGLFRRLIFLSLELSLLPLLHDVATWLYAATELEVVLVVVAAFLLAHISSQGEAQEAGNAVHLRQPRRVLDE